MTPDRVAPTWDLLVRGETLDPAQSISGRRDVAFTAGKVTAVASQRTAGPTSRATISIRVRASRGSLVLAEMISVSTPASA